ncbi:hypothetical protein F4804DRAFT_192916 [Jackrogersella minutella]|nr:hypothetical protein F4804DRAFT_192916 [Jackrogersella minutella]
MVFPSRGCITCRKRRIKCDSVHPTCGRCGKASRTCVWDQNEELGLVFKSENAFAQGKPRRPWKSKDQAATAEAAESSSGINSVSPTPSSAPAEDEPFHFWVKNFIFRDDEIPEFAREYFHYLVAYRNKTLPDSSLHLAISALSHAVFGRAIDSDKALEDAELLFSRSIAQMQSGFQEMTQENIHELLITAMLMAFYENIMYGDARHYTRKESPSSSDADIIGSQFWENVCHHRGAAGLLKLRQERGWEPDLPLERAARRQLIRTCILRGIPAAPWLQDGAQFGERGPVLDLDSIMVRVAALRSKSLHMFLPKSARFSSQPPPTDIASEARDIDIALESWSSTIPDGWKFSTKSDSRTDATFDGLAHIYASHGHAAIWNRYRAIHIIINSLRKRALCIASRCSSEMISTEAEQEACQKRIDSLATDLCRGIPFFVDSRPTANDLPYTKANAVEDNTTQVYYEILPKLAALLAWPLALTVSTEAVPEPQREWLKVKMKSVANSLGDSILETVADQGEFKF